MKADDLLKKWVDKVIASKDARYIYDFASSMNDELSTKDIQKLTDAIMYTYSVNRSNNYIFYFILEIKGVSIDYIIDKYCESLPFEFTEQLVIEVPNINVNKIVDMTIKHGTYKDVYFLITNDNFGPTDKLLRAFLKMPEDVNNIAIRKISFIIDLIKMNIGNLDVWVNYVIDNATSKEITSFIINCNEYLDDNSIDRLIKKVMNFDSDNKYDDILDLISYNIGNKKILINYICNSNNRNMILQLVNDLLEDGLLDFDIVRVLASSIAKCGDSTIIIEFNELINYYLGECKTDERNLIYSILANGFNEAKDENYLAINIINFIEKNHYINFNLINNLIKSGNIEAIVDVAKMLCVAKNALQCNEYIRQLATAIVNSGILSAMYHLLINSDGYAVDILMNGILNSGNIIYISKSKEFLKENDIPDIYDVEEEKNEANRFMEFMLLGENQRKTVNEAIIEYKALYPNIKVKAKTL